VVIDIHYSKKDVEESISTVPPSAIKDHTDLYEWTETAYLPYLRAWLVRYELIAGMPCPDFELEGMEDE